MSVTTYDKDRELFARVGKDNRIEVYNSFNGKLLHSFTEVEETENEYTLLAFSSHNKTESKENLKNLVAVSSSGTCYLYDVIDFKKKGVFSTHSKTITAVVLGKKYLFTADTQGKVYQWDCSSKKSIRNLQASEKMVSSMTLNNKETQLILANNGIQIVDLSNFRDSKKISNIGSQNIKEITFTQDDKYLVLHKKDSLVSIYAMDKLTANDSTVTFTLNANGPVQSLSVFTHDIKRSNKNITQYLISALLESSQVNIFAYYQDEQYNKGAESPVSEINPNSQNIYSMNLISTTELVLSIFEKEKYHFERVKFFDKNIFIKSITLERSSEFDKASSTNKKQKISNDSVAISGNAVEMKQEKINLPNIKKNNDSIASAGTIVDLITQSLKADNDNLLLSSIKVNFSVIQSTVKSLPSPYAYSLLVKLLKYLATDNSKSLIVLPWINCIIKDHSGYLLSVPNLSKKLSVLNSIVQDKFDLHNRLSKLVGKFDLIQSQTKSVNTESVEYDPTLVYDEASDNEDANQDEDGDMTDDNEDSDSDEFDGMGGDDDEDDGLDEDIEDLMDDDDL
ncbi:hypothetical protein DICPUDRAFT_79494 [Dictyostelium purpureum]|uniref:Small-subunit processome Utp12 domain-containing protein n=1 Tax=Dictyostelium purpureum TaxID=5786 RepID=F0ZMR7_DICPU|nr:uncharacterized protein DICPUDRAFT_79494 [Dictyostelium purpureum]EGC34749.1 hypothetical protein DICPUDRAFT_79494 [Dictyostelium purpureum]|eukprot:XP_003288711.1 hypothetical protein DICPUDRAFT_79494 [Dictyostelium purpureum]